MDLWIPLSPLTTAALLLERHARLVKSEIILQKAHSIHASAPPPEIQSLFQASLLHQPA